LLAVLGASSPDPGKIDCAFQFLPPPDSCIGYIFLAVEEFNGGILRSILRRLWL
jgi:hypothetical protein